MTNVNGDDAVRPRLERFKNGQRVRVLEDDAGNHLNAEGTVARLRHDGGAWIALDQRQADELHPFAGDDDRGTHVLAYPEYCEGLEALP